MESNAGACDCGGAQRCDSAGTAYRTQQNYGRSAAVQEIESVSFRNSYDHVGSGSYLYYTDYVGQNTQNIKITDPTAISLISYYLMRMSSALRKIRTAIMKVPADSL